MLTPTTLQRVATHAARLIENAKITIDGVETTFPILKNAVTDNKIDIVVMLDNTVSGTITKVDLVDASNHIFDTQTTNITKQAGKLFLITYKIDVVEEVN